MRGFGQVGSPSFSWALHSLTFPAPEPDCHRRLCLLRSDPGGAVAKMGLFEQDAQYRGRSVCQRPRCLGHSLLLGEWGRGEES